MIARIHALPWKGEAVVGLAGEECLLGIRDFDVLGWSDCKHNSARDNRNSRSKLLHVYVG